MRKLLLLLPLMALASCSGGDVLKSNKPFEMVCDGVVFSIDPELPKASMQGPSTVMIWDRTKVTPDQIVLEEADAIGGRDKGLMLRIDRNTGVVYGGRIAPPTESSDCTFNAV